MLTSRFVGRTCGIKLQSLLALACMCPIFTPGAFSNYNMEMWSGGVNGEASGNSSKWSGSATIAVSSAALVTASFLPLISPSVALAWLETGALGLASSVGLSQRNSAAELLRATCRPPGWAFFQIAIRRDEGWFSTSAAYGELEEAERVVCALQSRLGCQTRIIRVPRPDQPAPGL